MTATPGKYVPRFYSEVVKEAPGSYDDCCICSGLVLLDCATLGEAVTRDDGRLMNTILLRELRDEAGLKPNGPLRLNDVAKYLAFVSERAGFTPPFELDYYPGHGGKLRLTWEQFKERLKGPAVAILLGNPIGVKDPKSPLRTVQNNDDYGHAIAVMDGNQNGARVYDPLHRMGPDFPGVRVSWDDLQQFTTARKNGDRLYGTPEAIACAVAVIGSDTEAARVARKSLATIARLNDKVAGQRAQTQLATEERDAARAEASLAHQAADGLLKQRDAALARVKELEALPAPDCALQVKAERVRVLDLLSGRFDEIVAEIR